MYLNLFVFVFIVLTFFVGIAVGHLTHKRKPPPGEREVLFYELKEVAKERVKLQDSRSITERVIRLKANDKALNSLVKRF